MFLEYLIWLDTYVTLNSMLNAARSHNEQN